MNFNQTFILGRLTRDPEIREVNNTNVVMFTVASNYTFSKKNGERGEETIFLDCEQWGPAAVIIHDRAVKGTTIFVTGRLKQDNFVGKDGAKRMRTKLRVDKFQFGEGSVRPERTTSTEGATSTEDATDSDGTNDLTF